VNPDAAEDGSITIPSTGAPEEVSFGDGAGNFESIDVKVPAGEYELGGLILQDNMVLSLDEDGVVLTFSEEAVGPSAQFIAGQTTEKGACSLGCHNNFYQYVGRDAEDAALNFDADDLDTESYVEALATPCGSDTVVIPHGYNVNLLALGFHAYKEVLYVQDGEVVYVESPSQLPEFMLYPATAGAKVLIGDDVDEQCQDSGNSNPADLSCVCASECSRGADALDESNTIRAAAQSWSKYKLAATEDGEFRQFDFTFARAWDENSGMTAECEVTGDAVALNLKGDSYGDLTADGNDITVEIMFEQRSFKVYGALSTTGGLFDGQRTQFPGPIAVLPHTDANATEVDAVDVKGDSDAALAMRVYAAVLKSMDRALSCNVDNYDAVLATSGWHEEEDVSERVYIGGNLPQMDVNRMVDANNKQGVVDAAFEAIESFAGWTDLSKDVMFFDWKLVNPEERAKGRRSTPIRHGYATNLIQVSLEFTRYSTTTGVDYTSIRDRLNHVLATYDTTTHHSCFTFEFGFDDACISELVTNAIAAQLAECTVAEAEQCRDDATATALAIILEIKGCGLLGSVTKNGKTECSDPDAQAAAQADAEAQATEAVEKALGVVLAEFDALTAAAAEASALANQTAGERAATRKTETDSAILDVVRGLQGQTTDAGREGMKEQVELILGKAEQAVVDAQAALDALNCPALDAEVVIGAGKVGEEVDEEAVAAAAALAQACTEARDLLEAAQFEVTKNNAILAEIDGEIARKAAEDEATKAAGGVVVVPAVDEEEYAEARNKVNTAQAALSSCTDDCEALQTALDLALALLEKLDAQQAEADKSASTDDGDSNGMIIGIAAAVVVLVILAAMVVVNGKDGGGSEEPVQKAVIAFENPMYDDPAQNEGTGYAQPEAADQGLYDEPTFQPDEAEGGGYLDVQPDEDEDEEEEEAEEEEDEEEEEEEEAAGEDESDDE
jgi:hypothetical protein